MTLQGTRLPDAEMGKPGFGWKAWAGNSKGHGPITCPPGSYMKVKSGKVTRWWLRDPNGDICSVGDNHGVTENADGTITVTPSIINPSGCSYHGFLREGVWT